MSLKDRKKIDTKLVEPALVQLSRRTAGKVKLRGNHAFTSVHEILGQITEEFLELSEAVRTDKTKHKRHVRDELFDLAIASIWGVLSIDTNSIDQ